MNMLILFSAAYLLLYVAYVVFHQPFKTLAVVFAKG